MLAFFYWIELQCDSGDNSGELWSIFSPRLYGWEELSLFMCCRVRVVNGSLVLSICMVTQTIPLPMYSGRRVFWGDRGNDDHRPTTVSHNPAVLAWTLGYIFGRWLHLDGQNKIYIKL